MPATPRSSSTDPSRLDPDLDRLAIASIRALAMDAPLAAHSGHQGTAMALAPLGHVLYSRVMRHHPAHPQWPDRDRFILSNGHASILQYALLYLCGYGLELDDLRAFRQWGSSTPGHPEVGHTPGVEVTTGPLGQGVANAVGMAIAERLQRATLGDDVVNHHTWVLAGDGCLMEGLSHEAASLAGHLGLGRLTCIFDDNRITIDGGTDLTVSDDVPARFRSYGWHVIEAGEIGEDCDALEAVLLEARSVEDRPTLVVLRTRIGYPSPDYTDRHEAHGNPFTADDVSRTKAVMGVPDEPFSMSEQLVATYRAHIVDRADRPFSEWMSRLDQRRRDAGFAATWDTLWSSGVAGLEGWREVEVNFDSAASPATRVAVQAAISATAPYLPSLVVGSADLTGNTGARWPGATPQQAQTPGGRQIYYGVREHAMAACMVGMSLHGGVLPVGGTFFVFADYLRPALRLAALSKAPVIFIFSHDSVGVGEDGPTHQPVEHLATLRALPGLQVIRPADAHETVAAWKIAVETPGPTALVLSRQNLPQITDGSAVLHGAGVVGTDVDDPHIVLLATGSEVALCRDAAALLSTSGLRARVVSMPSWDRFERAPEPIRNALLPASVPVLSVEAATTFGWARWSDDQIGIDRFGASAPGSRVLAEYGFTAENVAERARQLIAHLGTH